MKDLKTISAINFISVSMIKRLTVFILLLTLLPLIGFSQNGKKGSKDELKDKQWKKVTICHNSKTIEISENAMQAHLNHGDAVGPCEDSEDFTGTVIPFLESTGKVDEPIGPELTALTESFNTYGNAASDEIFVISENTLVLIEIVAQRNQKQAVIDFLNTTYGITEFTDEDLNDLLVTVLFPIEKLPELNLQDEIIRFVTPFYPALTNSGITTSLGDVAQQSDNARNAFGIDGEGITVGVLSDSYNVKKQALRDISNGDLPGLGNPEGNLSPVMVLEDYPSASIGSIFSTVDEGRAMLQIVHDVAPKANLAFRTGVVTPGDMAQGILELRALANCDIIVDDITHFKEPFFQDGVIAQAVNTVTADGAKYITSAGNFGFNSYESQFSPASSYIGNHDFNSGGGAEDVLQHITMGVGFFRIVLQWDDDYYSLPGATNEGALTDLDIYIINDAGDTLVNNNTNNLGRDPIEVMTFFVEDTFATSNIVIHRASGTDNVNFKYVVYEGKDFQFKEYTGGSSTITGHANSAGAMTVGAVLYYNTPAFDSIPTIASFSSRGGLLVNGSDRRKPDFIAPNGVNTTVELSGFNIDGDIHPNFFGTSASAPHAAGVAALLLQARTRFDEEGYLDVRQLLQQTAIDMETPDFDNVSGSGLILADAAMLTFATPKPTITELVVPSGATPGVAPFELTINGKNLHDSTKVSLAGIELPTTSTVINSSNQLTVSIPIFIGDSSIQASTIAISSAGTDGGTSERLYLLRAPKKKILVTADDYTKTYGQRVPEFTATISVDGVRLDSTSLTLENLGLDSLIFQSPATSLSIVGSSIINPVAADGEITANMLELYDYTFDHGNLVTEKALLKITPNDLTKVYGEKIEGITYSYELDTTNIDPLDYDYILDNITTGHSSTFVGDDVLAIVDRGRGIVNRGRGIVNRGRGIVNRGRGIVNGTGLIITPTTLINRGRGIVNGNISIDMQDSLFLDYELDSANTLTNRGRGIVNGGPFAAGEATTNRGRGIVNDEGILVDRGRGIVNDGALVNGEGDTDGFDELIVIVDSTDYAVSSIFSINMISGLEVTPDDSLHYIVPGGYFALGSQNFELTYGLGNLKITPAPLDVVVHDKTILDGDSIPVYTSTFTGFVYDEDASFVFDSINYEPETYQGLGTYDILPTFVFGNDEINYLINPVVPGTLSVIEFGVNGRIATAHYNDLFNLEMRIVNSDGRVPVTLSTGPESIRDPQFSPDGSQLAFTLSPQDVRGPESIWKVNIDGTGLVELTNDTLNHSSSYSHDGRKIGYIKDNEIAIMNSDGTNQAILTSSGTNKRWTSFSPNGEEIIYAQSEEDIYNGSSNSIWKVDINTLHAEQVSPVGDSLWHRSPVYLKDGSKIIYVRQDRIGQTPRAIMSMDPDGTNQTAIYYSQYITNDVVVSPDNTRLAFTLADSLVNDYVLYTMNIDGSNLQEIYREPILLWWPSWGTNPDLEGADLSVSAITIERSNIIFEQSPWTYIDYTVTNTGNADVTGPIEADIFNIIYNGDPISRPDNFVILDTGVVLAIGESVSSRFAVGHLNDWPVGTYSLHVRVDSNNDLVEVAETNNLSAIVNFEVLPVPSNGRIAIAPFNANGDTDLVLVNSDGSNPVTLVGSSEFIRDPQFSPDGTQIVFTMSDVVAGGQRNLWKINVDGSNLTQLTSDNDSEFGVFSPDGTQIALVRNSNLVVINNDGTGEITLPTSGGGSVLWPTYSNFSNEIYYTQTKSGGYNDIWKIDLNGLIPVQVSPLIDTLFYRTPEILKDDSKIIYTRADQSGASGNAIMSMNLDGSGQTVIYGGSVSHASVSPDNTMLAFIGPGVDLHTMNIDGSNVSNIYSLGTNVLQPSWGTNPDFIPPPPPEVSADIWMLSNADPDYSNPPFDDYLIAYDNFNDNILEQVGYNTTQSISGSRIVSVSEDGAYGWIMEFGNDQLTKVSADGTQLDTATLSIGLGATSIVSDERVYALEYNGSISGGGVFILNQNGEYLDSANYGGWDIVADETNSGVWIVGDDIDRLDMNLNHQFTIDPISWSATSVDVDISGNAWVGVGNPDQLLKVSTTGTVLETVSTLSGRPYTVRVNKVDGKVWYVNGSNLIYYDPSDQSHSIVGIGHRSFDIDYHNGVIWSYTPGTLYKYSLDGDLLTTIDNPNIVDTNYIAARSFFGDYNQVPYTSPPSGSVLTQGEVSIYPNPVIDNMNVEHADETVTGTDIQIVVFDGTMTMQSVSSVWNSGLSILEVDMTGLLPGIYFVHVSVRGVTEIFRVQKN